MNRGRRPVLARRKVYKTSQEYYIGEAKNSLERKHGRGNPIVRKAMEDIKQINRDNMTADQFRETIIKVLDKYNVFK